MSAMCHINDIRRFAMADLEQIQSLLTALGEDVLGELNMEIPEKAQSYIENVLYILKGKPTERA